MLAACMVITSSSLLLLYVGFGRGILTRLVGRGFDTACCVVSAAGLVPVGPHQTLPRVTSLSRSAVVGLDPGGLPESSVSYPCEKARLPALGGRSTRY